MSGRDRDFSEKRNFLDSIFSRKRLNYGICLTAVAVSWLLAEIFGTEYRFHPVAAAGISFLGIFLVLGFQLINRWCTGRAMDLAELFLGGMIGSYFVLWFVFSGFWNLFGSFAWESAETIGLAAGFWAGLCTVHNLRKKE